MAAARAWVEGSLVEPSMAASAADHGEEAIADARRWGMANADIQALKAALASRRPGGSFHGVWPDNREVVDAFLAVASQWRTAVAFDEGRMRTLWIGLDYAGAAVAWAARGIELTAERLAGIQVMEMTARRALNGGER